MRKVVDRLVFVGWYLLSLLPLDVLYLISDILYPIIRHVIRYRRNVIRGNLLKAFPEKSEEERKSIEKDFYRFFCDYVMETVKLFTISKKQLMSRMTFEGVEEMANEMERLERNFSFVYLGHYGNWEWIASLPYWCPESHPEVKFGQIYHPLRNPFMDQLFLRVRGRFGGENIPMKQTLRRIIEHKRAGDKVVIGFISDQLPKWNSIHHFSPFFGIETAVFTGTEQIGKQVNALIYYAKVTRPKRGYYHCQFIPMTEQVKEHPDYEVTDTYMTLLEQMIKESPYLWLWSHKRWKRTKEEWEKRQKENCQVNK